MNEIRDVYNKIYLYVHTNLDKDINRIEKEGKINDAIHEFLTNKGLSDKEISPSLRRSIKVKILQTYKNTSLETDRLENAIAMATEKVETKMMLGLVPSDPIIFKPIKGYQTKKEAYLNEIKNSDKKEDKKLKEFITNPKVQKLASLIEQDFAMHQHLVSLNLAMDMTIKDFANLMLTKYEPALMNVFTQSGVEVVGRDEKSEIYFALILLQKGDDFANATKAINDFGDKMDRKIYLFLGPLISKVATPLAGVEAILDYKKS